MKKILYSFVLIVSFVLYGLFQNRLSSKSGFFSDDESGAVTPPANLQQLTDNSTNTQNTTPVSDTPPSNTNTNTNTNTNSAPPKPTPTPTPTPTPPPKGQYKDGSYTGIAADAYYGFIQVKAVISGGKITDVIFLQYPNDRNTSREINAQAMPWLKQEAIAIQGSNVDTISGASESSKAFRQSMASALSQAKT